jgi:hypothetical protein
MAKQRRRQISLKPHLSHAFHLHNGIKCVDGGTADAVAIK